MKTLQLKENKAMKKILFTISVCGLCLFSCTKPDDGGNKPEPDPDPVVDDFVPELPSDNSSEGVRHLVMLTDFTGSDCPGCPALLQALDAVLEDETIAGGAPIRLISATRLCIRALTSRFSLHWS